jgi:hypothetical protein
MDEVMQTANIPPMTAEQMWVRDNTTIDIYYKTKALLEDKLLTLHRPDGGSYTPDLDWGQSSDNIECKRELTE